MREVVTFSENAPIQSKVFREFYLGINVLCDPKSAINLTAEKQFVAGLPGRTICFNVVGIFGLIHVSMKMLRERYCNIS
jgi:hypothetical protein